MINKIITFLGALATSLFIYGCASNKLKQEPFANMQMKHGLAVVTGPERTVIGVNDKGSLKRGKKLYMKYCLKCHGATGVGDGRIAKEIGIKPANLAKISKVLPNYFLVIQINEGNSNMPAWKNLLTDAEVWDITNYIKTLRN